MGFTDSLLIWPRMTGEPELGVLLFEYDFQEDGVTCATSSTLRRRESTAPMEMRRRTRPMRSCWRSTRRRRGALLSRARRSGACRDSQAMGKSQAARPGISRQAAADHNFVFT